MNGLTACIALTLLCMVGAGVGEFLKLGDTTFLCFFGFIIAGISTIVLAFRKDETEEEDDDEQE